jgi:hypothetical protein
MGGRRKSIRVMMIMKSAPPAHQAPTSMRGNFFPILIMSKLGNLSMLLLGKHLTKHQLSQFKMKRQLSDG